MLPIQILIHHPGSAYQLPTLLLLAVSAHGRGRHIEPDIYIRRMSCRQGRYHQRLCRCYRRGYYGDLRSL